MQKSASKCELFSWLRIEHKIHFNLFLAFVFHVDIGAFIWYIKNINQCVTRLHATLTRGIYEPTRLNTFNEIVAFVQNKMFSQTHQLRGKEVVGFGHQDVCVSQNSCMSPFFALASVTTNAHSKCETTAWPELSLAPRHGFSNTRFLFLPLGFQSGSKSHISNRQASGQHHCLKGSQLLSTS